jgi:nicotinamidase/pyrazinamidase
MLEGPLVFVDVDTQRDFLEPDGALYVPRSAEIVANLARLTAFARRTGIPVLATACAHTIDDVEEIARFGPHCMVGTPGQRRIAATAWDGGDVLGPADIFSGRIRPHLTIEKRAFDVFSNPEAARVVAVYNETKPTFVVYGVATDFCVKAAVVGLRDRESEVAVVVDAIRAIDSDHEVDILSEFSRRGALLVATDGVCSDGS